MKPEERILAYNQKFPPGLAEHEGLNDQPLNGRIYGVWVIGNNYKNNSDFYGEYPHSVKERILALFPDAKNILHLFSGTLKEIATEGKREYTYDISNKFSPTICDDVRSITKHGDFLKTIDLVLADPPYEKSDFEKYGCEPFNKAQVLRDLGVVMRPGSHVVWLDTRKPMYSKETWFLVAEIMVSISTNHRYRGICIFQKL